ncbi:hypothetical protein SAMN04489713_1511 [Actinomadura madurae]|uniref:Uncharacterized protein n=1 Tax=Actinomadura madurae TaxID=1993 RepID=A0A1I5Z1T2_9ACTN|nr:hypothetical protein SAMN04489713_1511 [Actinomadura madurae]
MLTALLAMFPRRDQGFGVKVVFWVMFASHGAMGLWLSSLASTMSEKMGG